MHDPVIVIGAGRSGTSHTSMLLHTRLGVDMGHPDYVGHNWKPPKWRTTHGNWERCSTRVLLWALIHNKNQLRPDLLPELVHELKRIYGDRRWGFKHPDFVMFIQMLSEEFPEARWIFCDRDPEETARSMCIVYPKQAQDIGLEGFLDNVNNRRNAIMEYLGPVPHKMKIDLDEYKAEDGEEKVIRKMAKFLKIGPALVGENKVA